ncbi:MAG: alpha/beta hydrolase [Andreesenia angusta]|nr:alpha/beta hydrolase [Andreesenia angusta]
MYREVDLSKFKKKYLDIKYDDKSEYQTMDIILPEEDAECFPVILYIHGGSWLGGDKRKDTKAFTFKIPSQGYVLATMNYRLAQENSWPAQIEDVFSALKYILKNAEDYKIDKNRIYIWGDSAGAHLAQFAAATQNKYEDIKNSLKALISFYGVSDITGFDRQAKKYGVELSESTMGSMKSPCCMLMGEIIDKDEDSILRAKNASPIYNIKDGFIPSLIQHGTDDKLVPVDQSIELVEKINEKSPDSEIVFETFTGADHADDVFKSDENIKRCIDFLDKFSYDGKNPYRKDLKNIEVFLKDN